MATVEQNNRWNELTAEEQKQHKETYRNYFNQRFYQVARLNLFELNKLEDEANFLADEFGKSNLRNQILTFEDAVTKLFKNGAYQIFYDYRGFFHPQFVPDALPNHALNFTSEEQYEKLIAINKLLNVAQEINKNPDGSRWQPNWKNEEEKKYTLALRNGQIVINHTTVDNGSIAYFRTEELARHSIGILGETTAKKALTTKY